jgi:hypothetical protein
MKTILLGQEGFAHNINKDWLKPANIKEREEFINHIGIEKFNQAIKDIRGHTYFLVTILDHAPDYIKEKIKNYSRIKTL